MYRTFRVPTVWRDMNRLFNQYPRSRVRNAPRFPAINMWVNDDGQIVNAEMPGIRAEDVDVSVDGDILTISGVRGSDELPEGAQYLRRERSSGNFSRSIQLPYKVASDRVDASFKNGILTITLPRAEADKPKKITIK
jgi:HSP20 family protein